MDITIRIQDSAQSPLPDRQRLLAEVAAASNVPKSMMGGNRELDLLRAIAIQARAVTQTLQSNPVEREQQIQKLSGTVSDYEKEIGDALWGTA